MIRFGLKGGDSVDKVDFVAMVAILKLDYVVVVVSLDGNIDAFASQPNSTLSKVNASVGIVVFVTFLSTAFCCAGQRLDDE